MEILFWDYFSRFWSEMRLRHECEVFNNSYGWYNRVFKSSNVPTSRRTVTDAYVKRNIIDIRCELKVVNTQSYGTYGVCRLWGVTVSKAQNWKDHNQLSLSTKIPYFMEIWEFRWLNKFATVSSQNLRISWNFRNFSSSNPIRSRKSHFSPWKQVSLDIQCSPSLNALLTSCWD